MKIFVRFFHTKYIKRLASNKIATPRAWRRECQNFSYDLNEWPLNFTRLHAWWWVLAWLEPLLILHFATPSSTELCACRSIALRMHMQSILHRSSSVCRFSIQDWHDYSNQIVSVLGPVDRRYNLISVNCYGIIEPSCVQ